MVLVKDKPAQFIELKRPDGKGKVGDFQIQWRDMLTSRGFNYHLIDNYEALDVFIEEMQS
jgi:hypothetical protein